MKMNTYSKRASLTIESAIAFTTVMALILSVVSVMNVYQTDIIMQSSVEQTCEELSLFVPLSMVAGDTISTVSNALPNSVNVDSAVYQQNVDSIASMIGINSSLGNPIMDLLAEGALSSLIEQDVVSNYIERRGSSFGLPETVTACVSIDEDNYVIEVFVSYTVITIAGSVEKNIYSIIPIYGEFDLFLQTSSSHENEDSVWDLHNFERGDYFREEAGSNLPSTFPVLTNYENGVALSCTSIDLTADSYANNYEAISERVTEEIDDLAGFDGASVIRNGECYQVSSDEIVTRNLVIYVPENSSQSDLSYINSLEEYATANGVDLEVRAYGNS